RRSGQDGRRGDSAREGILCATRRERRLLPGLPGAGEVIRVLPDATASAQGRYSKIAFMVSMAMACAAAAWAQTEKKPNIALSGCLLSQGYATFILDNARIDATGERAATAAPTSPSAGARPANEPAIWVLDEPGNMRSHTGERVQVIGL